MAVAFPVPGSMSTNTPHNCASPSATSKRIGNKLVKREHADRAARGLKYAKSVPGHARGIVRRPDQAGLGIEIGMDLALAPRMVAERDDIRAARLEKHCRDVRRDPDAARGVLAVND